MSDIELEDTSEITTDFILADEVPDAKVLENQERIKLIIKTHYDKNIDFFKNDSTFDNPHDLNDGVSILFLLFLDSKNNFHMKLFNPRIDFSHKDLIFFKVNKEALYRLLMERVHIKTILNDYKDKFVMVGSYTTGIYDPFNRIVIEYAKNPTNYINHRTHNNINLTSWIRFQVFPAYTTLCFCEQVFYVCICNRYNPVESNRWALLNPKKSQLLNSIDFIGLYGIQGLNQSERIFMNKCILQDLYVEHMDYNE